MTTITEPPFDSLDGFDWEPLSEQSIEISQEQLDRALQLSQPIAKADQQWQVYLQALALAGFEQWLEEWAPDLQLDETQSSLHQPAIASLIDAVCHLTVGHFRVCLIAVSSLTDSVVKVPRAIVERSPFVPQMYVLVEVQEEQMQSQVYGYLRYDQLIAQPRTAFITAHWDYFLPLDWFTPDPNQLLLELRYLDSAAIALPPETLAIAPTDALHQKLLQALPQLRSPSVSPQHLLSWDDLTLILSTPALTEWLYHAQQATPEPSPASPLSERLTTIWNQVKTIGQQAINVGLWLHDQLDEVAQELSWTLVPPLSPGLAEMRSVQEELETVVTELHHQAVGIPAEARGAYRDLRWGNVALRLYVLTWALPVTHTPPEWMLLVVLSRQPRATAPANVTLQIQDAWQVLVEKTLNEEAQDSYLYAQVVGSLDEQFWVKINLNSSTAVTFCFAFNA